MNNQTGQHVGINIHFEYEGEIWLLGTGTTHYIHMNTSETEISLSNHGTGGDAPIKESYDVTTDELVKLIRNGSKDKEQPEETTDEKPTDGA